MSPKTGLESDLGQFDLAHVSDLFCLVCLRFALGLFWCGPVSALCQLGLAQGDSVRSGSYLNLGLFGVNPTVRDPSLSGQYLLQVGNLILGNFLYSEFFLPFYIQICLMNVNFLFV